MKANFRDPELTLRMMLTAGGLAILYLAFLSLLYYLGFDVSFLAVIAAILLFSQYYFSDRLVLMSLGAKILSEREAPELHSIVSKLSREAGIPKPRVALIPSPVPNALATGRNLSNSVVAVTEGLLSTLNREELEAVLAHEISHIRNRDVLVLTIASFISMLAWFVMRSAFFYGMFGGSQRERNGAAILVLWVVSAVVWFISFLLIRALSRIREFAADRGSAVITGNPEALISALLKISGRMSRVPEDEIRKVEGANAFFIVPAISRESILSLFATHPPIEKRIERLRELQRVLRR
ncbi:MAG: heat shock protein HtpX [Archaeoglobi archaeon]|nr:heat shock protein HtpX [Archaeoglobi archaeon]